jgi:hypothetical protein
MIKLLKAKIFFALILWPLFLKAENGGGRGSVFINYHPSQLSTFATAPGATMVMIGGNGMADLFGGLRLGGGGASGFIVTSPGTLYMGMGYGGIVADYRLATWLSVQCLLGAGGFSLSNAAGNIASGGFILLHPTLTAEISITPKSKLGIILGYFLPNEVRLTSATLGVSWIFGAI